MSHSLIGVDEEGLVGITFNGVSELRPNIDSLGGNISAEDTLDRSDHPSSVKQMILPCETLVLDVQFLQPQPWYNFSPSEMAHTAKTSPEYLIEGRRVSDGLPDDGFESRMTHCERDPIFGSGIEGVPFNTSTFGFPTPIDTEQGTDNLILRLDGVTRTPWIPFKLTYIR